jgi:hypothetical protein
MKAERVWVRLPDSQKVGMGWRLRGRASAPQAEGVSEVRSAPLPQAAERDSEAARAVVWAREGAAEVCLQACWMAGNPQPRCPVGASEWEAMQVLSAKTVEWS